MRIERIGQVLLVAMLGALLLALAACGGGSSGDTSKAGAESASSETAQEITVPDLSGMYCLRAVEQLEDLGLEAAIKSDSGKAVIDQTNWKVIEQDPAAGETLKQGQTVILIVSKDGGGKEKASDEVEVTVPDVTGMKCSKANKALKNLGLKVDIESDNGKAVLKKSSWTVVSQDPAGGSAVSSGSTVKIVVTKGKASDASSSDAVASDAEPKDDGVTIGQKNALRTAKNYLSFTAFSYSGLYDQLKFEGYTDEEAAYGVDNCGADWNEQAAKKAEDYLSFTSFSHQGLVEQLEFEGFTPEQAEYGVSATGL